MLANPPWQILGSRCGKIVSYGSSVAGRTVVMGTVLMGGGKSGTYRRYRRTDTKYRHSGEQWQELQGRHFEGWLCHQKK